MDEQTAVAYARQMKLLSEWYLGGMLTEEEFGDRAVIAFLRTKLIERLNEIS